MIIKSISLKNFQCYSGEHEKNSFAFNDGLNLIIGDNGGGKSKLFDAFYWVLYDEIFHTDRRQFVRTKIYQEKIISDKAKDECNIGDAVEVEVVLVATTTQDREYKLTRIYKSKKLDERSWEGNIDSKLLIDERKGCRWVTVSSDQHTSIMQRVIPDHLKPYMWFQGEQVDSLMDFRDKATLVKAINLLSNIQLYDDLIDVAKKGHAKAESTFRRAQKKLIGDKDKADYLNRELNNITKKIEAKKTSIDNNKENLEIAKDKIEELISQIDDAKKKEGLKKEKEALEKATDKSNDELTRRYNGLHKRIFTDYWVLRNSKIFADKFSKKYMKYFIEHNRQSEVLTPEIIKLPINIPQPIHVKQMLDEEKCFVCGSDAKKGSNQYEHISKLLKRDDEDKNKSLFKNDCSPMFAKLYDNTLGFRQSINDVDNKIENEFNIIQGLRNDIASNKDQIQKINDSFEYLIDEDKSENIVKAFRTHENNKEKYQSLLHSDETEFINLNKKSEEIKSSLDKLVQGKIEESVDIANTIFAKMLEVSVSARNGVFYNLIKELEEVSNQLFRKMTENNKAITGTIKLKKLSNGNYIPEIVGSDGYILSGTNDSVIILVKLALIMAIIISRGKRSENYSIILDAPTSKMAGRFTEGFYETLSKNFKQSIVVTYDFLDIDQRKLFDKFTLGSIYKLTAHYPKGDRTDRTDLDILIEKVEK